MFSTIWNAAAVMTLVAHGPMAGSMGERPMRCGLMENQCFPSCLESPVQEALAFGFEESMFSVAHKQSFRTGETVPGKTESV